MQILFSTTLITVRQSVLNASSKSTPPVLREVPGNNRISELEYAPGSITLSAYHIAWEVSAAVSLAAADTGLPSHGMAWRQPASKSYLCLPLAVPGRPISDPHPISTGRKRIGKGLAHILLKYLFKCLVTVIFLLLCFYGNQIITYQVTSETRQISCVPISIFLSKSVKVIIWANLIHLGTEIL